MGKKKGKKLKKVDYYEGKEIFKFPNEDTYEGEFVAHRSGVVWRHGDGIYKTNEGHTYVGKWKEDKIEENVDVKVGYPNWDEFEGKIIKNKYTGPGFYKFADKKTLVGVFADNKPVVNANSIDPDIVLVDEVLHLWYGKVENEYTIVLPEHIFYNNLKGDKGKGEQKEILPIPLSPDATKEEKEAEIFKKSKRISSELSFGEFRPYRFDLEQINRISPEDLLDIYFGREFRSKNPPVSVFYPTPRTPPSQVN